MRVPWYLMAKKGKGGGGYKTASGPIVSINDALAAPLRSLLVNIDPVQDLHGYDAPWPAGGGKNLCSLETCTTTFTGRYNIDAISATGQQFVVSGHVETTDTEANTCLFRLTDSNNNVLASSQVQRGDFSFVTSNINSDIAKIDVFASDGASHGRQATATYTKLMICLYPVTDATFSPYSNICPITGWSAVNVWVKPTYDPTANPTATIQLGQTAYGATLDVINGVLTVDRAYALLNDAAKWSNPSTGMFQYSDYLSGRKLYANSYDGLICSVVPIQYLQGSLYGRWSAANGYYFRIVDERAEKITLAEIQTLATNGNIAICYELATPITIPLTATQISTLQGQNNVWADSGDVTIEYLASGGANADLMKLAVVFMGRK